MPRVTHIQPPVPPQTALQRLELLRYGRFVPPAHLAASPPWRPGQPWTRYAPPAVATSDPAKQLQLPGPVLLPEMLMLEQQRVPAATAPVPVPVTRASAPAPEPEPVGMRGLLGW